MCTFHFYDCDIRATEYCFFLIFGYEIFDIVNVQVGLSIPIKSIGKNPLVMIWYIPLKQFTFSQQFKVSEDSGIFVCMEEFSRIISCIFDYKLFIHTSFEEITIEWGSVTITPSKSTKKGLMKKEW